MRKECYVWTGVDETHAESAEVLDVAFADYGGAGTEDGAVEMNCCREGGFKVFDSRTCQLTLKWSEA